MDKINSDSWLSNYIQFVLVVVAASAAFVWLHTQEGILLVESLGYTVLITLTLAAILKAFQKYVQKNRSVSRSVSPGAAALPEETRWREDIGKKIKKTKEIVSVVSFVVAFVFTGYNAAFIAAAVYALMRFIQYVLLEPQWKIRKDICAVIAIVGFLGIIILWASHPSIFSPVLAFLLLLVFCFLFIVHFYLGGLGSL
jgi:small-conductance mechanosensitive channel